MNGRRALYGVVLPILAVIAMGAAIPPDTPERHVITDAKPVAAEPARAEFRVLEVPALGALVRTACTVGVSLEVTNGATVDTLYGAALVPCPSYGDSAGQANAVSIDSAGLYHMRTPWLENAPDALNSRDGILNSRGRRAVHMDHVAANVHTVRHGRSSRGLARSLVRS